MKIYSEKSLSDFDFWSGAADTVKYLTSEELDQIESMLEDLYPDGINETDLNDLFWHDDDTIAEWLGYSSFEKIMNRDDEEEEETFICPVCGEEWDNEEDAKTCCEDEDNEK